MRNFRRSAVTLLILVGTLVGPGVAVADDVGETAGSDQAEQAADTLFNFGYDLIHRVLLWNLSSLDGLWDCSLENGSLTVTFGAPAADGQVPVDSLEDEDGVVSFPNRPAEEVDPALIPADQPLVYSGADADCGLSGADVTGPNGQVNHGMFMKLFNSLWDGPGRGCVVRHLAKSDLGKGEQQVQAGDETVIVPVAEGDQGSVEFTTAETDCEHGKQAQDLEPNAADVSNGKPDHAGKPNQTGKPESPGNSSSAPGHNK